MKNVFIIHGVDGYPEENWFPWLRRELETRGYRVIVPQFPTPEGQTLENWLEVLEPYEDLLEGSIVVGHSLGVPFLLKVIEKHRIEAAFFVAGYVTVPEENQFYEGSRSFIESGFDFAGIKKNCEKFVVFHSDNDPYVSLDRAKLLARELWVEVTLIKGAGHFNSKAGYDKFEKLLKEFDET